MSKGGFHPVLIVAFAFLTGCAGAQNVANPRTITLKSALVDTVDAIDAAHREAIAKHTFYGFYGCSVTAVFNVQASETDGQTLNVSSASAATIPISIGGTISSNEAGSRGNTVTVVFDTKYCFPNAKAADDPNISIPTRSFLTKP